MPYLRIPVGIAVAGNGPIPRPDDDVIYILALAESAGLWALRGVNLFRWRKFGRTPWSDRAAKKFQDPQPVRYFRFQFQNLERLLSTE